MGLEPATFVVTTRYVSNRGTITRPRHGQAFQDFRGTLAPPVPLRALIGVFSAPNSRMPLLGHAEVGTACDELASRAGDDILMAAGRFGPEAPSGGLDLAVPRHDEHEGAVSHESDSYGTQHVRTKGLASQGLQGAA